MEILTQVLDPHMVGEDPVDGRYGGYGGMGGGGLAGFCIKNKTFGITDI